MTVYASPILAPPKAAGRAKMQAFLMATPCPACGDLWLTLVEQCDGEWNATCGNGHALWNPVGARPMLPSRIGPGW